MNSNPLLLHHLPLLLPALPLRADLGMMVRETKRLQTLRGLVGTLAEASLAEAEDLETMDRLAEDPAAEVLVAEAQVVMILSMSSFDDWVKL